MHNYKELVAVFLIAGALFSLGNVVVKQKNEKWKQIRCQNNLRKIYKLADKYQQDHNGQLPPYIDKSNKSRWKFWPSFILKYGNDPSVFYCPSNPKAAMFFTDIEDPLEPKSFSEKSQSYGMNYFLGNKKHTLNINNIAEPSYVVYFGDSQTQFLRATKWCWKDDWAPRHQKKANFVFMDGSVKVMGPDTLGICHKWENWEKDSKRWKNWKK